MKLTEDWRLLTADHAGHVRLWNSRDLVGARTPCLTSHPAFAPSIDDPASGLIDLEVGAAAFAVCCCLLRLGEAGAAWGCCLMLSWEVGAACFCWGLLFAAFVGSGCCVFSAGGGAPWPAQA